MLQVYRWPTQKPKRPKEPIESVHFQSHWVERTHLPLSVFRKRWRSAQFLGATERDRWGYRTDQRCRTGRIAYYALGPWIALMTMPQGSRPVLLSVWPREWFEKEWEAAATHTPDETPGDGVPHEDEPPESKSDRATPEAGRACASVDACT